MFIEFNNKEFYTTKDLALSIIGGKCKIPVIFHLLPDINQRMLIRQLRELERDRVIERVVYQEMPPKVEYKLTDIGKRLDNVVYAICDWGDEFLEDLSK